MKKKEDWSKLALTSALGLLLSNTFVFLAVLPIRHLRLIFGRWLFVLSSGLCLLGLSLCGLWAWAFIHLSLCLLIGFYRELEENQVSIFPSAVLAISTTTMASLMTFFTYLKITNQAVENVLIKNLNPFIEGMQQISRFQQTNINALLWYLPSILITILMILLFLSLSLCSQKLSHRNQLKDFRLPDALIWVFIASLAMTFISVGHGQVTIAATNVLIITGAAYFFQGIAVLTHFLDRFSILGFWRLLAYFIAFFQIFPFISGLGILDYWFDFRRKQTNPLKQKSSKPS